MQIYLGNFTAQMTRGFRVETTTSALQYFYNNSWFNIAGGGGTSTYTLPTATSLRLGGVKIGAGINVAVDGTISVTGSSYTLPVASSSTLGGVKIGNGVGVSDDGTISVTGFASQVDLDALANRVTTLEGVNTILEGI